MTIEKFISKWNSKSIQDDGSVVSKQFVRFAKDYKTMLSDICQSIGATLASFRRGHYDLSAFIEKDGHFVYISFSVPRGEMPLNLFEANAMHGTLARTARHAKDYTGGMNTFCSIAELPNRVNRLLKM